MYLYRENKTDLTGTKMKTAKHISTSLDSTWCLTLVTILLYIVSQASIMLHDMNHTLKNQSIKCLKTMSAGRLSQECIVILSKNAFQHVFFYWDTIKRCMGCIWFCFHLSHAQGICNQWSVNYCMQKPNGQSKW